MEDPELGIWNLDLGWYMELWGLRSAAPKKDKILECPAAPRSISPACPACPPGAPDTGALEHQEHDGQELPDALHSCAAGGTGTHRRTVNGCSSIVKPNFPEHLTPRLTDDLSALEPWSPLTVDALQAVSPASWRSADRSSPVPGPGATGTLSRTAAAIAAASREPGYAGATGGGPGGGPGVFAVILIAGGGNGPGVPSDGGHNGCCGPSGGGGGGTPAELCCQGPGMARRFPDAWRAEALPNALLDAWRTEALRIMCLATGITTVTVNGSDSGRQTPSLPAPAPSLMSLPPPLPCMRDPGPAHFPRASPERRIPGAWPKPRTPDAQRARGSPGGPIVPEIRGATDLSREPRLPGTRMLRGPEEELPTPGRSDRTRSAG